MLGARAEGSRRIEEVLSLFPEKDWGAEPPPQEGPPPIRWCTTCPNTHELFLFPDTPAGYLAQVGLCHESRTARTLAMHV